MGQGSSHGLGFAIGVPERRVWVLDGDGSLLMNLGTLVTIAEAAPENLIHFVFENGTYEANGAHPIPGAGAMSFAGVATAAGILNVHEFSELDALREALPEILTSPGPTFVDLKVVRGGHNGLTCAAYLARSGLRVLVCERRHIVGGPCAEYEYFPGYRASITNSPGSLEPKVVADLELERHGLTFTHPDPTLMFPFPDGRAFVGWRDRARVAEQIRRFSARDVDGHAALFDFLNRFAERLGVSLLEPPPTLRALAGLLRQPGPFPGSAGRVEAPRLLRGGSAQDRRLQLAETVPGVVRADARMNAVPGNRGPAVGRPCGDDPAACHWRPRRRVW